MTIKLFIKPFYTALKEVAYKQDFFRNMARENS